MDQNGLIHYWFISTQTSLLVIFVFYEWVVRRIVYILLTNYIQHICSQNLDTTRYYKKYNNFNFILKQFCFFLYLSHKKFLCVKRPSFSVLMPYKLKPDDVNPVRSHSRWNSQSLSVNEVKVTIEDKVIFPTLLVQLWKVIVHLWRHHQIILCVSHID